MPGIVRRDSASLAFTLASHRVRRAETPWNLSRICRASSRVSFAFGLRAWKQINARVVGPGPYHERMMDKEVVKTVREKFRAIRDELDERARRLWAAVEAESLGHGGLKAVSEATGLAQSTIVRGQKELREPRPSVVGATLQRVRRPGAGRKPITETDPGIVQALDALVEPTSRGDPMSPLRWTCKSTRVLAVELTRQGHRVSHTKVGELLVAQGYSLQGTSKQTEGSSQHPDRNEQFLHINDKVKEFQKQEQPVISVDTKKKELIGDFANKGREYQPKGEPEKVRVHDFIDEELGKAIPYGVYDVTQNSGWVSVGVDHDTAEFAVESIGRWWRNMGRRSYPGATELLITADGGGSNGSRSRLWKLELQSLADETGLSINVCHLPPGTSKWNKIEHRMFSHITQNWRGRPLESLETVVSLIANTTTDTGLRIRARLDRGKYPTKIKVTDDELSAVQLVPDEFRGEWNYVIDPRKER